MRSIKHAPFLFLLCAIPFSACAQSTAFTYQGRLAANGLPYTGLAEMQFALFDTPTGGTALASNTPTVVSVNVSAGLFTTSLDFGSANFRGADRWLEIQVRTNLGSFFTLSPRQPLTPAPSALYANMAGTVTNSSITAAHIATGQVVKSFNGLKDAVNLVAGTNVTVTTNGNEVSVSAGPWLDNGSNTVYNGGSVGIGTASPQAKLHVSGGDILAGAPGQEWIFHTRSFAGSDFLQITDSDDGVYQFQRGLVINQSGNVGIGITAPIAGLHVKKEPIPPGGTLALEGDTHTYLTLFPDGAANGRKGYIGFAASNAPNITIANEKPGGRIVLFDRSGALFPSASEESLRIVRGVISVNGDVIDGSGYTCTNDFENSRHIIFNPAFSGAPTVTATFKNGLADVSIPTLVIEGVPTAVEAILTTRFSNDSGARGTDREIHFIAIGPR